MYSHATMLYLLVETPLHAGSGRGLGAVDLPIQRERATGYPMLQAPGLKGKLRAQGYRQPAFQSRYEQYLALEKSRDDKAEEGAMKRRARRQAAQELGLEAVFGPETDGASDHAGAIGPGDARLLLLPVRSLAGVFAWATSTNVLARFKRDWAAAFQPALGWDLPDFKDNEALVAPDSAIVAGGYVVLEEFSYTPKPESVVKTLGEWLADNALPVSAEYAYWRRTLPGRLIILPETEFRDFAQNATEVVTRVRLNDEKKTVERGALWTEESLPADTLLYAPLYASAPRKNVKGVVEKAEDVIGRVKEWTPARVQLGGDETVGHGLVAIRFGEVRHG